MRHFFEGAPLEFADAGSQLVLAKIKAAGDLTVYSQSLSLLTHFNLWNKETCTDESGSPTGRCCNDCIGPTTHKLAQYSGLAGLKACSADVLVTAGAGDIDRLVPQAIQHMQRRRT